jgi:hypothetical protein
MRRTIHVLLTLAILFSVVSAAYFLSELVQQWLGLVVNRYPYRESENLTWSVAALIKYMVYWSLGLIGVFVAGRILTVTAGWRIALLIAFSYLLVLGSWGGLEINGNTTVRLLLSLGNIVIFILIYQRFERTGASPAAAA